MNQGGHPIDTTTDDAPTQRMSELPSAPSQSRASLAGEDVASGSLPASLRSHEGGLILMREEADRTVALMRLIAPIALLATVTQWIPENIPYRVPCAIVYAATFVFTLVLLWRFRDRTNYDPRLALVYGMFATACVLAATASVGVFSPTIMAASVGVYFFGASDESYFGWLIYLMCAVSFAVMHALSLIGVMPLDHALVAIEHPDVAGLTVLAVLMQLFLGLTFFLARRTRTATLEAFARLEHAGRQIRQREALLNEARAELDQERAGRLGRYSGQTLDDYTIDEIIGRGAMGEVYRATRKDGSVAALKFLHPMVLEESGALRRFLREAEVASALESRHVPKVFGLGQAPDGAPYIAMELLQGADLARRLRNDRRLKMREVLKLATQVAAALEVARERGVVHRDLKPQNLFLAEEGGARIWKVLDFGVSKLKETHGTQTRGGAIGTPSYMSPEQAQGRDVDHRTDIFALGVIVYRALTGRPAFTGSDSISTLYNVVHVQPVQPSTFVRVSHDVERVLAIALAKDRERRFGSAAEFAAALEAAADSRLAEPLRASADALIEQRPWGSEGRAA